jgi:hypothetical protein
VDRDGVGLCVYVCVCVCVLYRGIVEGRLVGWCECLCFGEGRGEVRGRSMMIYWLSLVSVGMWAHLEVEAREGHAVLDADAGLWLGFGEVRPYTFFSNVSTNPGQQQQPPNHNQTSP